MAGIPLFAFQFFTNRFINRRVLKSRNPAQQYKNDESTYCYRQTFRQSGRRRYW
jgi:hypothetical protein